MAVDSFQTFGSGGQKSAGSGCLPDVQHPAFPDRIPARPYYWQFITKTNCYLLISYFKTHHMVHHVYRNIMYL